MQAEPRGLHTCREGDRELSPAGYVDVEPGIVHPPCNVDGQKGLARVVDLCSATNPGEFGVKAFPDLAGAGAHVGLVDHIHRRAEFGGNSGGRYPGDDDLTRVIASGVLRPHRGRQFIRVCRHSEPRRGERVAGHETSRSSNERAGP